MEGKQIILLTLKPKTMKTVNKIRLFFIILCITGLAISTATAQQYKIVGNEVVKVEQEKQPDKKTGFTHTIKNQKFDVYKSPKGAYYIIRVSKKTGKEYKQYLKIE
jgi:hypothetical protein